MIKRRITILIALTLPLLVACGNKNALTKLTSDELAVVINKFDQGHMSSGAAQCAEYLAGQGPENKLASIICDAYTNDLFNYLKKQQRFKHLTYQNVIDKSTWQHYLASNLAERGLKNKDFNSYELKE